MIAAATTPESGICRNSAIKKAAAEHGRSIDEDHFGAGFPFFFGKEDDPAVLRSLEAYRKRTGRQATNYFAVGDASTIVQRISDYVGAGVEKFVLRPIGRDDDQLIAQTEQLLREVLPEISRRWPKPAKVAVAQ